jgi:hypothetical protein
MPYESVWRPRPYLPMSMLELISIALLLSWNRRLPACKSRRPSKPIKACAAKSLPSVAGRSVCWAIWTRTRSTRKRWPCWPGNGVSGAPLAQAIEYLKAALTLAKAVGACAEQSWLWTGLAEVQRIDGRLDQAAECVRHAMALAQVSGRVYDEELAYLILKGLY